MDDFQLFLEEMGLTQEQLDAVVPLLPDPLPKGLFDLYELGESTVEGTGVFATEDVDGYIGTMWVEGQWTEAGRYLNHSNEPNAEPVMSENVMVLVGTASKGDELFVNYRDVRECLVNG